MGDLPGSGHSFAAASFDLLVFRLAFGLAGVAWDFSITGGAEESVALFLAFALGHKDGPALNAFAAIDVWREVVVTEASNGKKKGCQQS